MTAVTTAAALGTTYGVTAAAVLIRGDYDASANTGAGSFTNNATGGDLYFVFDNDGTGNGTTYIGVVLVGAATNGIAGLLMSAGGVATFV
jgi:hypothetical protein